MSNPLVTTAKKMLMVLNEHLAVLDKKHKQLVDEYVMIPSQDNHYFCVSNTNGVINLFQDAAYVVEQILVISQENGAAGGGQLFQLALQDSAASRSLTFGSRPTFFARPATLTSILDLPPVESEFIPPEALVPLFGVTAGSVAVPAFEIAPNNDYWLDLPVEWLLPRGGVVSVRFNPAAVASTVFGDVSALPQVILSGYKVY